MKTVLFRQIMWGSLGSWLAVFLYAALWKVAYDVAKVGQISTNVPIIIVIMLILGACYFYYFSIYRKNRTLLVERIEEQQIFTSNGQKWNLDQLKDATQDRQWLILHFQDRTHLAVDTTQHLSIPLEWTRKSTPSFWKWVASFYFIITIIGGYFVYTTATNLNGELAWKINEWQNDDKIHLPNESIYITKLAGILDEVRKEIDLEPKLMTNSLDITFTQDGTIKTLETYIYAYDENETLQSGYLLYYDSKKDSKMTVHHQDWNGQGTMDYDPNNDLSIVVNMLDHISLEEVIEWRENTYAILYKGIRTWDRDQVEVRVMDEDGMLSGPIIDGGYSITGPSISLYVPGKEDTITPIRYVFLPKNGTIVNETKPGALLPIAANDRWVYSLANNELQISSDKGANWISVPVSTEQLFGGEYTGDEEELIPGSYLFKEDRIAFLLPSVLIVQSQDGGQTWQTVKVTDLPYGLRFRKMDFLNKNFGYVIVTGERVVAQEMLGVYVTRDGGQTWTLAADTGTMMMIADGGFVNDQTGFLSYGVINPTEPILYVTQDGGGSWNQATFNRPAEYLPYFVSAEVPTQEGDHLSVLVNQGPNGDYEGGKLKAKFISIDQGVTWTFQELWYPSEE